MRTLKNHPHSRGFTLVEVAFAIGIAAFALVSILALMNLAVQSDGLANREAARVAMTEYITTALRSAPFDALWLAQPDQVTGAAPSTGAVPADTHYYFTAEGMPIADVTTAKPTQVVYECIVKKTPDDKTRSPDNGLYNMLRVQLQFYWPYSAAGYSRTPNDTSYANIARY